MAASQAIWIAQCSFFFRVQDGLIGASPSSCIIGIATSKALAPPVALIISVVAVIGTIDDPEGTPALTIVA